MRENKIGKYNIRIGNFPIGKNNSISDVPGVLVGHKTLDDGNIKTGVTAILPHGDNVFTHKVIGQAM